MRGERLAMRQALDMAFWSRFACLDCRADTLELAEDYMVRNDLWARVNPGVAGKLCIGCLERRLGRRLSSVDFTDCPLNVEEDRARSQRLSKRLAP